MNGVHLTGLEGTNPLGFLAALGVQVAFALESKQPRLWWSDDIVPHAVVDEDFTTERIAAQAMKVFKEWKDSLAVNPRRRDGSAMPKGDELKLTPCDTRTYLALADQCDSWSDLVTALVAEGGLDRKGAVANPSALYFTAANQKFLKMIRDIFNGVSPADLLVGLKGPWENGADDLPTLMWDVRDDRQYALMAYNPSGNEKFTYPGPEALAILGLSLHPVFGSRDRKTLTQGCSGSRTAGSYSWPLWCKPASAHAVKSLLAHAYDHPTFADRDRWFRSWGVFKVLRSPIRRPRPESYGRFGPPDVAWQTT